VEGVGWWDFDGKDERWFSERWGNGDVMCFYGVEGEVG
jgi:hypothetical protein